MVGIHHSDISLLADQKVLQEKLGKAYWRAAELEDDPSAPRAQFVSEEATTNWKAQLPVGFSSLVLSLP